MSDEAQPLHNEIIIIRRKSRGDHGHHGGAWKIAYADFVTAMMAFFLVMWLINAANEKTKAQVASYFNPVKLTDTTTSKKGLNEPTKTTPSDKLKEKSPDIEGPEGKNDGEEKAESLPPEKQAQQAQEAQLKEEQLFKNPYGVLAQLAGQAVRGAPPGHSEKGLAIVEVAEPGHRGGSAFRDPFDPLAWQANPEQDEAAALEKKPEDAKAENAKLEDAKAIVEEPKPAATPPAAVVKEALKSVVAAAPKEDSRLPQAAPDPAAGDDAKASTANAEVAIAIRKQLIANLKQFNPVDNPKLEVKLTREGVLLSLTDSLDFDMFAVGSAEPKPELVLLMEKVAATLKAYDGKIVIRGHTDARRFKNRDYDNWRLSTARAQMAYYMLIRAGIDENSVERIEGYADRNLKNPAKPESAENRRIELLLKVDQP